MKRCSNCKEWKPLGAFSRNNRQKDGFCKKCKACHKAYYERTRQARIRTAQAWIKRNQERARANSRRSYRKFLADAPEAKRAVYQARRAKSRGRDNGGSFTPEEWKSLCEQYGNRCLCCGEEKPLTVDHVVPLSQGGSNSITNIQPLCRSCNCRKRNRTINYRNTDTGKDPQ